MVDHVTLPVLCLAPVTYMAAKARKAKTTIVETTVDIRFPLVGPSDAPTVMRSSHGMRAIVCSSFQGRLWMDDTMSSIALDQARELFAKDTNSRHSIFGDPKAFPTGARPGIVPSGVSIIEDGRPEAEERLRLRARDVIFYEGFMWLPGPAPGISIEVYRDNRVSMEVRRFKAGREAGYAFAVDRRQELTDFLRENTFSGGFKAIGWIPEVEFQGSQVTEFPEHRVNPRMAIREAMAALVSGLVDHPPAILGHLRELAEIRDALSGEEVIQGLASRADAVLAAMEQTRLACGGIHNLGHAIRIGRSAIARSRTEVAPELSADMDALAALA